MRHAFKSDALNWLGDNIYTDSKKSHTYYLIHMMYSYESLCAWTKSINYDKLIHNKLLKA